MSQPYAITGTVGAGLLFHGPSVAAQAVQGRGALVASVPSVQRRAGAAA